MNFRVFPSERELIAALSDLLLSRIARAGIATISLAGGTTPRALYELLGQQPACETLRSSSVTWVTGDERWTDPDAPDSNSAMIRASLFAGGIPESHRFLSFDTTLDSPVHAANDLASRLSTAAPEGLDIALLGMGADGHTASLFPETDGPDITESIALAVRVERLDAWRLSLSLPYLRAARLKLFMVTGSAKRDVLARMRAGEVFPVSRVAEDGESWFFVDRAAYPGEMFGYDRVDSTASGAEVLS